MLKQLVAYVGFEAFIAGSRQYFRDHAYGNTTLADLLAALSAASGRDLADWARQWLQTSGISTLASRDRRSTTASLGTVDPPPGRRGPDHRPAGAAAAPAADRPVRLRRRRRPGPHGQRRDRRQRRPDRGDRHWPASRGRPCCWSTTRTSATPRSGWTRAPRPRSGPPWTRSATRWPGPCAGPRCGTRPGTPSRRRPSTWTPSQRFGPAETGIGVLLNVLGNASTAIERYVPAAERDAVRRGFLSTARPTSCSAAAPGSDQQLAWARTLAATSRYDASRLDLLRGILDGSTVIDGPGRGRRAALEPLARPGRQRRRPPRSSSTRSWPGTTPPPASPGMPPPSPPAPRRPSRRRPGRRPCTARRCPTSCSARPSPGSTPAPAALLAGFIDPYFECLEDVWAGPQHRDRQPDCPRALPGGPGPGRRRTPDTHPVIVRTDAWLAGHPDAPRALRRIIIEQRSHLHRSLTAQALTAPPSTAP